MFAERVKKLDEEPTATSANAVDKEQAFETIFPFDKKLEDDAIDGPRSSFRPERLW